MSCRPENLGALTKRRKTTYRNDSNDRKWWNGSIAGENETRTLVANAHDGLPRFSR
jgi:hypothetical protein